MTADTIHLFLNPSAGRGRAGRRQTRISALLEQAGATVQLHTSSARGDLEEQVFREVSAGASRIVIAGGDGSIHEAVNGLLRSGKRAAMGIIPTGTGNDFAKACDISLDWEHATRLLADRIQAGQTPRAVDAGRMNERFFANGAGIGFDAKVTRVAQSIRLPIGDLVYLLAIFKTFLQGIVSPPLRIVADDFDWQGPLTLAAIANGSWLGGMFNIAPMANNADGLLELIIARPVTRRRIVALLPKLMKGTHVNEAELVHQSVTRLSIESEAPVPWQLDGEVQEPCSKFTVEVLPGALDLL